MERMVMRLARRNRSLFQAGGGGGGIRVISGAFSTQQQLLDDPPATLNIRDTAPAHLIGRTPLVYLNKVTEGCGARIAPSSSSSSPPSASRTGHFQEEIYRRDKLAPDPYALD